MSKPDYKKAWEFTWEMVALAADDEDEYTSNMWLAALRGVADEFGIEVDE